MRLIHFVVTARPSWARIKSVVSRISQESGINSFDIILIGPAVSDRYGKLSNEVKLIKDPIVFRSLQEGDDFSSVARTCFEGSIALSLFWSNNRPDAVVVIADRTETLGVTSTASIMQIPIVHFQGGEISGSIDDKIRDANSKLADLHLTTNIETRNRLISIGEHESRIHVVGCPSIDLVKQVLHNKGDVANTECLGGVGEDFVLHKNTFGIIMFHPDTRNESEIGKWLDLLIHYVKTSDLNWLWFWPNPDFGTSLISKTLRGVRETLEFKNVKFIINLKPEIFIRIASQAKLLVGNSSFGIRESAYLGLPVVNLGTRQRGRQRGLNVLDMPQPSTISQFTEGLDAQIRSDRYSQSFMYGDGDASTKVIRVLNSWDFSLKKRF